MVVIDSSMFRQIISVVISMLVLTCCARQQDLDIQRISFSDYSSVPFGQHLDKMIVVPLSDNGMDDYMFSGFDKVICKNNNIYILDQLNRKIVIFNHAGNPIMSFSRRGRGPEEYLQITDFDVSEDGSILILDGQKDILIKYDKEGRFVNATPLLWQVNALKYLRGDRILLNIAPWDKTRDSKGSLIVANSDIKELYRLKLDNSNKDSNYALPAQIFNECGKDVLYHEPIDDLIYEITADGQLSKAYHVDLGIKAVPENLRNDIERHREEIRSYQTLVKAVYLDSALFIGSLLSKGMSDFVIDIERNICYEVDSASFVMLGVSGGYVVYKVMSDISSSDVYAPSLAMLPISEFI